MSNKGKFPYLEFPYLESPLYKQNWKADFDSQIIDWPLTLLGALFIALCNVCPAWIARWHGVHSPKGATWRFYCTFFDFCLSFLHRWGRPQTSSNLFDSCLCAKLKFRLQNSAVVRSSRQNNLAIDSRVASWQFWRGEKKSSRSFAKTVVKSDSKSENTCMKPKLGHQKQSLAWA